jgi:hypothetical protein
MRKNLPMILIRVVVGLVFLTEGILKFVYPVNLAGEGLRPSVCLTRTCWLRWWGRWRLLLAVR